MRTLLWLLLPLALAGRRSEPEEDRLGLAGLLVREGDWERASQVLDALPVPSEGAGAARYFTLRGLCELHAGTPALAGTSFTRALTHATEGRELLELHLARAQLGAGEPAAALEALDRAGEFGATLPGSALLRAEGHEALGRPDAAWQALEDGVARFPDRPELARQQVFLLVRLGLFREARERGERLLGRVEAGRQDAVAISEALRRGGETAEASTLLQAALLEAAARDGGADRDLLVQAARAALDDGQPRAAARFLEQAAVLDPPLALEAAEAWRRSGDLEAALRMNGEVVDPVAKVRQRLGLLLELESWDRAVALEERLDRLGIAREDDGVAYGLAYAWFRLGDPERAEGWLSGIRDPEVFRRATELRAVLAACDPTWGCQ